MPEPTVAPTPSRISPRILFALALLAFSLRVVFVLAEPGNKRAGDENRYFGWVFEPPGGLVTEKVRFSPFRNHMIFDPPLYPYFMAAVHEVAGSVTAIKIAQAGLGALLVVAVALVGSAVLGSRAGLWAAFITAVYPELIWFAGHLWPETLFMALFWWSMERLLAGDRRGSMATVACAGLLWGLAILARETILYFIPVAGLWLAWQRGAAGVRRAALFGVTALLVVAPWTYRNWVVFGAFVPVSTIGGQNLFQANSHIPRDDTYKMVDAVSGRIAQYRYAMRMGLEAIRDRQPLWVFEKLRDEMPKFWEADSMALIHVKRGRDQPPGGYGPLSVPAAWGVALVMVAPYLLVLAGFVVGLRTLPWTRETALLAIFFIYYVALHVVAHGFVRYRMPILPLLFLASGWAIATPRGGVVAPARRALSIVVGLLLAITITPSVKKNLAHPALGGDGAVEVEGDPGEGPPQS